MDEELKVSPVGQEETAFDAEEIAGHDGLFGIAAEEWEAIKAVAESYGISPEEVMCIGDSNNDLSMIENAGIGVAVANAKPAVQAAAKLVTASNDEDGVAKVIEQVVLC